MGVEILIRPLGLEAVWKKQYDRVATEFASRLGDISGSIAEVGCGGGRLTIPLMKLLGNSEFVLVDKFADRTSWVRREVLAANLRRAKLRRRARVVISDYLEWIRAEHDAAYDGVISCEFLPEITRIGVARFFPECFRVLKPGGVAIHCFWSPTPRNSRQRLVIIADSDPTWTHTPPEEWFSPKPSLVMRELRRAGFIHLSEVTLKSHLILRRQAAKAELQRWEVRPGFYEKYRKRIDKEGLEFPDWIIISAKKPSRVEHTVGSLTQKSRKRTQVMIP
jgi:cyclopropane fatty-acyl-phospholipid synthase-like methyltransferase